MFYLICVMRREKSEAVRMVMEMNVEGRERPKNKWLDVIKSDMRTKQTMLEIVSNESLRYGWLTPNS